MKRRYRLRLRLRAQAFAMNWMAYGQPYLSEEALLHALGEATIHRLNTTNPHAPEMDVELVADSPQQAVWSMLAALESIGLDAGRIVVVDLVKAAMQRALFGAGGFGALGLPTKNPWVVLVCAGLGAAIGVLADVAVNEAWAMIVAERVGYMNEWRFTEVPAPTWSSLQA
jgi:hypothetical protein